MKSMTKKEEQTAITNLRKDLIASYINKGMSEEEAEEQAGFVLTWNIGPKSTAAINEEVFVGNNPMADNGFDGLDGVTPLLLLMRLTQRTTDYGYIICNVTIYPTTISIHVSRAANVQIEDVLKNITEQTGIDYDWI